MGQGTALQPAEQLIRNVNAHIKQIRLGCHNMMASEGSGQRECNQSSGEGTTRANAALLAELTGPSTFSGEVPRQTIFTLELAFSRGEDTAGTGNSIKNQIVHFLS